MNSLFSQDPQLGKRLCFAVVKNYVSLAKYYLDQAQTIQRDRGEDPAVAIATHGNLKATIINRWYTLPSPGPQIEASPLFYAAFAGLERLALMVIYLSISQAGSSPLTKRNSLFRTVLMSTEHQRCTIQHLHMVLLSPEKSISLDC